ncbi:hypothetical protein JZ751_023883 [Albula glossodonta]|uniref:Kazal-like domain-containing protein n=1 Tax=Albula glossodonta TaxID=121402 RepID=A0A8T2NSK2_9TELE|nr:hypothetical protein JZ751_023883 [Albula glossodonta]
MTPCRVRTRYRRCPRMFLPLCGDDGNTYNKCDLCLHNLLHEVVQYLHPVNVSVDIRRVRPFALLPLNQISAHRARSWLLVRSLWGPMPLVTLLASGDLQVFALPDSGVLRLWLSAAEFHSSCSLVTVRLCSSVANHRGSKLPFRLR